MKILTLNAGSGSQKASLHEVEPEPLSDVPLEALWSGKLDTTDPDQPPGKLVIHLRTHGVGAYSITLSTRSSWKERLRRMLGSLWSGPHQVLQHPSEITAVANRVVHGGSEFIKATQIDSKVEAAIQHYAEFAPLHNPHNLDGIRVVRELLGQDCRQFAIFDTAFHHTIPEPATIYAGPIQWLDEGIKRYGFHGTSFRWASERAAQLMGRLGDPSFRTIICHLGGGCSLAATVGGKSIDTTMGFTPLDGIAMSTRSGAIDPGILFHLLRKGISLRKLERMLNKESGLKGLSQLSGDTRILFPAIKEGNKNAQLALDVFVRRLRAGIGSMIVSLGVSPDAILFTDAIGETEPSIRAAACKSLEFLGIELDSARNEAARGDSEISSDRSPIKVLTIKSREDWQLARECVSAMGPASGH